MKKQTFRFLTSCSLLPNYSAFFQLSLATPRFKFPRYHRTNLCLHPQASRWRILILLPWPACKPATAPAQRRSNSRLPITCRVSHTRNARASANLTDTVTILAGFVITEDVNTLRDITLTDTLVNGTRLLDASGNLTQNGSTLTWSLPDLGTADQHVYHPHGTDARGGGRFRAYRQRGASAGQAVGTACIWYDQPPAVMVPDGVNPALTAATPDADIFDDDMLWK